MGKMKTSEAGLTVRPKANNLRVRTTNKTKMKMTSKREKGRILNPTMSWMRWTCQASQKEMKRNKINMLVIMRKFRKETQKINSLMLSKLTHNLKKTKRINRIKRIKMRIRNSSRTLSLRFLQGRIKSNSHKPISKSPKLTREFKTTNRLNPGKTLKKKSN